MNRYSGIILVLVAAMFWGIGNSLSKLSLEYLGPFTSVGLRCTLASLLLSVAVACERDRAVERSVQPASFWRLMRVAALFASAITLQQLGFRSTSATNVGFIVNICTVFTPLVAWLLYRHNVAPRVWGAAVTTLLGVLLMSQATSSFQSGDLWSLAATLAYALWMVDLGQLMRSHGQALQVTTVQFSLAALPPIMIGMLVEPVSLQHLQLAMLGLLLLAMFGTAIPYLFQAMAQCHLPASQAAIVSSSEAVFGALAASIILGERMMPMAIAGATLVFSAIVWSQTAPAKAAQA